VRKINRIFWHCTATPEGRPYSVEAIRKDHKARGWRDIGYHFVIGLDGTIYTGRPVAQQGAGVNGHNADSVHVCYVGGLDLNRKPKDTRTPEQKAAMYRLTESLVAQFPGATVHGHREFAAKACPSFDVQKDWPAYLASKGAS
jgi:N-acetylmuramoyl-L-alanine amidase